MRAVLLLGLLASPAWSASLSSSAVCTPATACDAANCVLPDCKCSGTESSVDRSDRPQIVYLTYDDAFTDQAEKDFYHTLFNGTFQNPDGCPIRATHFIAAEYTDYSLMNLYRNMGHEMASHSITHRTDMKYWTSMSEAGFEAEMVGLRKMIGQFANIPTEEIVGTRIPFLMEGGEEQFAMMQNHGFQYDCTQATQNYGYMDADRGLFPYTLDYKSVQDCPVGACPKCSYPGIWMQPMIDLEDNRFGGNPFYPNDGLPCSMLDACIGFDTNTADEIKKFLERNFNRVYQGNRAPWGLYMHAAWFQGEEQQFHYDGYKMFVEYLSTLDDVWIVPVRDGIAYAKEPVNITELTTQGKNSVLGCAEYEDQFYARDCGRRPLNCKFSDVNDDDHHNAERYMKICPNTLDNNIQACPDVYPWLGNPCGGNSPCLD